MLVYVVWAGGCACLRSGAGHGVDTCSVVAVGAAGGEKSREADCATEAEGASAGDFLPGVQDVIIRGEHGCYVRHVSWMFTVCLFPTPSGRCSPRLLIDAAVVSGTAPYPGLHTRGYHHGGSVPRHR